MYALAHVYRRTPAVCVCVCAVCFALLSSARILWAGVSLNSVSFIEHTYTLTLCIHTCPQSVCVWVNTRNTRTKHDTRIAHLNGPSPECVGVRVGRRLQPLRCCKDILGYACLNGGRRSLGIDILRYNSCTEWASASLWRVRLANHFAYACECRGSAVTWLSVFCTALSVK